MRPLLVCDSVHRNGGVYPIARWDTHPLGRHPPRQTPLADTPAPWILRNMVNKWAVRILLECILLFLFFEHDWWLFRVTLVVAFGFLNQIFGRLREPMNRTMFFNECSLRSGDTLRWWGHSSPVYHKTTFLTFFSALVPTCACSLLHSHPRLVYSYL